MEWEQLTLHIRELKDTFDKSYKCISQNRPIHKDTIYKNAKILVDSFNTARTLVHENGAAINKTNWSKLSKLLIKLRKNLITVKDRYNLNTSIPTVLNTPLTIDQDIDLTEKEDSDSSEGIEIKEKDLHDLTIPAVKRYLECHPGI